MFFVGMTNLFSTSLVTTSMAAEAMRNRRKAALAGSADAASNLPAMKVPPHKSMVKTKEIYVITGINVFFVKGGVNPHFSSVQAG
jgi:hypothetical protein